MKIIFFLLIIAIAVPFRAIADGGEAPSATCSDRLIQNAYKTKDPNIIRFVESQYRRRGNPGLNDRAFRNNLSDRISDVQPEGAFCEGCNSPSIRQGSSGIGAIAPILTALVSLLGGSGNMDMNISSGGNPNMGFNMGNMNSGFGGNMSMGYNPNAMNMGYNPGNMNMGYNPLSMNMGYNPNMNMGYGLSLSNSFSSLPSMYQANQGYGSQYNAYANRNVYSGYSNLSYGNYSIPSYNLGTYTSGNYYGNSGYGNTGYYFGSSTRPTLPMKYLAPR